MGDFHLWGDEDMDWKALDAAMNYLRKMCHRWARLGIHVKEKYGVMRVETTVAYWSCWPLHQIVHPGYYYYRWPTCLIGWVEYPLWWFFDKTGIQGLVIRYQKAVLKYFWKRAAKKWPHISEEILDEYEWTVGEDS